MRLYLAMATVIFGLVITAGPILATMYVSGVTLAAACAAWRDWVTATGAGLLAFAAPFAIAAFASARLDHVVHSRSALTLFVLASVVLGYLSMCGFIASEQAMLAQRWTAAVLAVGLLPFEGAAATLLLFGLGGWIAWRRDRRGGD